MYIFISQCCPTQCPFEQPENLNAASHRQWKRLDAQVSLCHTLQINFILVHFLYFFVLSVDVTDSISCLGYWEQTTASAQWAKIGSSSCWEKTLRHSLWTLWHVWLLSPWKLGGLLSKVGSHQGRQWHNLVKITSRLRKCQRAEKIQRASDGVDTKDVI